VSQRSGRRVAEALRGIGRSVVELDVGSDLLGYLHAHRVDAAFVALHGASGEDGAIRAVLDLMRIPYVGADPRACRSTFDKPRAKDVLAAAGLVVPAGVALPESAFRELGASDVLDLVVARYGLPLMVKPARAGSSQGATAVRHAAHLPAAMVGAFAYGDVAVIEQFVEGREVAVSVLDTGDGPVALPPVEIVPDGGAFDYTARYTAGLTEYFTPARLTEEETRAVSTAAIAAHQALGLRDMSRADIIVDAAGVPHILELNVAPGMTETSLFPMAIAAARLDMATVLGQLLDQAASRAAIG
jgi:D-alanine-D-alanine ligase